MKEKNKIGIGILTYQRENYYNLVIEAINGNKPNNCFTCVVNDGLIPYAANNDADVVISNNAKLGVAKSKNKIIDILLENNCEHIFIVEDDILIKEKEVYDKYINAADETGIHHMCYEKVDNNGANLTYRKKYENCELGFYKNPQGAFMYTNGQIYKKICKFDENYLNAFEHIDFEYTLVNYNLAPPFWYFPDLIDSESYITTIDGCVENSTITNKENYENNLQSSAQYFIQKWDHFTNQIPVANKSQVEEKLQYLQKHYARN
jgi:hypothetical protein